MTFAANEAKVSHTDGPLNVAMQSCSGNEVSLLVHGKVAVDNMIIVVRDAAGKQLAMDESESWKSNEDTNLQYKAVGTIARVELFTPTEYVSRKFDVLAYAEPDVPLRADSFSVKVPRYVPGGTAPAAAAYDLAALKAQTSIVAQRDYAMFGFNTPSIVIKLPHTLNSAFASVDFGQPKLLDANGNDVSYSPEEGIFDLDSFSTDFRFEGAHGAFAYADGTVHLRYPSKIRLVTLTSTKPIDGAVEARFHGALVRVNVEDSTPDSNLLPEYIAGIRAFDASGRQLKTLNYSGWASSNGVTWNAHAFWGTVAKLQVVVVDQWLTLDLPFHLPPAAELPKSQMGTRPADYD